MFISIMRPLALASMFTYSTLKTKVDLWSSRVLTLTKQLIQDTVEAICLRYFDKVPVVLLDLGKVSDQISISRLDPLSLLDQFPANEQDRKDEDHEVS